MLNNSFHYGSFSPPPPGLDDLSPNERDEICAHGCCAYALTFALCLFLCILFGGCSSVQDTASLEQHRIETMLLRMDSTLHQRSVAREDSTWRQEILRQFRSIRESSDTSRYVVADSGGNIIRERIIINNTRETTSETGREERLVLLHRLEVVDSTLRSMQRHAVRSDSLLLRETTTAVREVERRFNAWELVQLWLGRLVLVALALAAVVWLLRKRMPWIRLFRK